MRWTIGTTVTALLLGLAREAGAQQATPAAPGEPEALFPTAELDYRVAPDLACPSAEQLRAFMKEEMTYDAFDVRAAAPSGRFHVIISRTQGSLLLVRVSFDDTSGKQNYETEFTGRPVTARICDHLVAKHVVSEISMQLSLLLARGARGLTMNGLTCSKSKGLPVALPAAEPAPCRESPYSVWPPEPPLLGPAPEPAKPPERWPIALRFGASVGPEIIATGWGSIGLSAEVGARYRAVSAGAELHGDPPLGAQTVEQVGVNFARLSGALLLCAHFGWFAGCGVGDMGRYLFPNHIKPLPASAFYGTGGVRAGMEFPVAPPRIFLRASMDVRASFHPLSYTQMGRSIFQVAGPGVGLGLGLLFELPP